MVKPSNTYLACIECDLLMLDTQKLEAKQHLVCPQCEHVIAKGVNNAAELILALSLTALVTLVISISFPFLGFEVNGQSNTISLLTTLEQLEAFEYGVLALLVAIFMLVIPAVFLGSLVLLTINVHFKKTIFASRPLAKLVTRILPWAMVDVFIFSVLVALIKMLSSADVTIGVAFWSYVVFTILYIEVASIIDTHRLWSWVDSHG